MNRFFTKVFATLMLNAILIISNNAVQAQTQETVRVNTDLVTTWVNVNDPKNGLPVKGLTISNFNLQENDKSQEISLVKEGQPLSIMILLHGLGGWLKYPAWYQHIPEIVREFGADTEIALMLYDSTTVLVQPLTKDVNTLAGKFKDKEALYYQLGRHLPERIAEAPPGKIVLCHIGDAAYAATEYLQIAAAPTRRKIIIFISQRSFWMDESTTHLGTEVEAYLEKTDTTVYSLLHGNDVRVHDNDPMYYLFYRQRVKNRLRGGTIEGFIKATGGTSITGQWEECDEMFMKLARQIRSSYTIGYYPENTNFDGKFRRIKLELSKSGKAKFGKVDIKTREGYHAVRRTPGEVK